MLLSDANNIRGWFQEASRRERAHAVLRATKRKRLLRPLVESHGPSKGTIVYFFVSGDLKRHRMYLHSGNAPNREPARESVPTTPKERPSKLDSPAERVGGDAGALHPLKRKRKRQQTAPTAKGSHQTATSRSVRRREKNLPMRKEGRTVHPQAHTPSTTPHATNKALNCINFSVLTFCPPPKRPLKARLRTHSRAQTRSSLAIARPAPSGHRATRSWCSLSHAARCRLAEAAHLGYLRASSSCGINQG